MSNCGLSEMLKRMGIVEIRECKPKHDRTTVYRMNQKESCQWSKRAGFLKTTPTPRSKKHLERKDKTFARVTASSLSSPAKHSIVLGDEYEGFLDRRYNRRLPLATQTPLGHDKWWRFLAGCGQGGVDALRR